MSLELRTITDDEFPLWAHTLDRAFGNHLDDEEIERYHRVSEIDRAIAVFDRDQIVATAGANSFELTVPGNLQVRAAGVTGVSVRASHRRRGLLRRLMEHQLDDIAARGEPVAILTASEAAIYGRFGYGLSSLHAQLAIDTDRAAYRQPFTAAGRFRETDADGARNAFPQIHDRARRATPGDINRLDSWWDRWIADPPIHRHGGSARFYVVYESAKGKAEGYLAYRIRENWKDALPNNELAIDDMVAVTPDAYAAIWRYALDVDLVGTVSGWGRPVDEPVRWLLADPRQLRTKLVADYLWTRVMDVPAALRGRRYGTAGQLTLEVTDGFDGRATGRFTVDGGPDGATCAAAKGRSRADIALDADALGALYLGGFSATQLAAAGRVTELRAGAVARADAMFRCGPAPHCRTGF